jgi:hypothetical protein
MIPHGSGSSASSADVPIDIDAVFADDVAIQQALDRAAQPAYLLHEQLGFPLATWQDGKVVWIAPEDIPVSPPR